MVVAVVVAGVWVVRATVVVGLGVGLVAVLAVVVGVTVTVFVVAAVWDGKEEG